MKKFTKTLQFPFYQKFFIDSFPALISGVRELKKADAAFAVAALQRVLKKLCESLVVVNVENSAPTRQACRGEKSAEAVPPGKRPRKAEAGNRIAVLK